MKKRIIILLMLIIATSLVTIGSAICVGAETVNIKNINNITINKYSFSCSTDIGAVVAFIIGGIILVGFVVFGIVFFIKRKK